MAVKIQIEHNGSTHPAEIMRIDSTRLGYQDHGILTADLSCSNTGGGVSVGGYALDVYSKDDERRIPTAYGFDHVVSIMRTVGVERWEALPGRDILIVQSGKGGWGSTAIGIASLDGTRVLIFSEHLEAWKAKDAA